ncbi:sensor histidine kinase [Sulfitobacter sp. SK012]|uniref:sensor histidine kinase n=1 Tax=Sulfitobacter sp. SK012 TaxID=1389005 RepID=UPI000E09E2FB|nr:sensor histidine kinase [Sulfitobacter sp. SK012]AXI44710.1 sensor histidine kinase [Sulfitobacter sp. SK012]
MRWPLPPGPLSLRMRLTLIILIPLLCIAVVIGAWALNDAQSRASDRFDRSLLSAALAISRDVAVSGGDALSPETNTLLRDTSGGPVFYHVYAPDGVFITGYATPPVPPSGAFVQGDQQTYFEATYQDNPVRVLRFQDAMQIEGVSGQFNFTVWQDTRLRTAIVRDLSRRTFSVTAPLIIALALIVWFGVRLGLSPLIDLQAAIAQRSSDELTPIRRAVPQEVRGITRTLNALLGQVETTLKAKDDFISDAAHQLRNPIAGILAMSEAVQSARTAKDARERSADLLTAARQASDLANQLLTHERAKGSNLEDSFALLDINAMMTSLIERRRKVCIAAGVALSFSAAPGTPYLLGDELLLSEAILNLIDNTLAHATPTATEIHASVVVSTHTLALSVSDNGPGIPVEQIIRATERFVQLEGGHGSGLGLAIVKAVAQAHHGTLTLENDADRFVARLVLPYA